MKKNKKLPKLVTILATLILAFFISIPLNNQFGPLDKTAQLSGGSVGLVVQKQCFDSNGKEVTALSPGFSKYIFTVNVVATMNGVKFPPGTILLRCGGSGGVGIPRGATISVSENTLPSGWFAKNKSNWPTCYGYGIDGKADGNKYTQPFVLNDKPVDAQVRCLVQNTQQVQ